MIDHDGLFKKLLKNFFPEFIELFFPDISNYWQRDSLQFLPQEIITDIIDGEKKIVDTLVQALFQRLIATIEPRKQEEVMEIVTDWMERASQAPSYSI